MKKNNKGFTLIELLAAIVVLGLLVAFTIPLVTKNINFGRNKTYVLDANKLVALAEYKINSNSLKIEKPDPNNCIVLSFDYLNDGSISNPPNKGTYFGDASFVVVKNNNGKYEYAVSLIEKHKGDGGYSGVKLSTVNQLKGNFGSSRVSGVKKDDLIYLNQEVCEKYNANIERNAYNADLINSVIGNNFIEKVEKVYLNDELEQGEPSNAAVPKIKQSYVEFDNSVSRLNEVGFIVYVNAIDNDSDNLFMCVKDSENKNDTYPKNNSQCDNYKSGSDYSKKFSYIINKEQEESGITKYFYISIYDSEGNVSNAKFEKKVSKNTPPDVKISVSRLDDEKVNSQNVKINLTSVADDRAKKGQLEYCISQSSDSSSCVFKSYNEIFKNDTAIYTIRDNSGNELTVPDGKTYTIYVHVRDNYGAVGSDKVTYTIHGLTIPRITYNVRNNTINGKNDLNGYLDVTVDDDYSIDDVKIKVTTDGTLGECSNDFCDYNSYKNNESKRFFSFSTANINGASAYNGKNRTLYLQVINKYGGVYNKGIVISNIYNNVKPIIKNFKITGPGYIGVEGDFEENNATVSLEVSDDLDSVLQYCIEEESNDKCSSNSSYKSINVNNMITFKHKFSYNGEVKNSLKVHVKDSNNMKETATAVYDLYKSATPKFEGSFSIVSTECYENQDNCRNLNGVVVKLNDFTVSNISSEYKMKFCYKYGSDDVCIGDFSDPDSLNYQLSNGINLVDKNNVPLKHNGQTINAYFAVKDSLGFVTNSNMVSYKLYKNSEPKVVNVENEKTKQYEENIGGTSFNDKDVIVSYFKVYDADLNDTYRFCVTTNNSICDKEFSDSFIAADNEEKFSLVAKYDEDSLSTYYSVVDNGKEYTNLDESFVKSNIYYVDKSSSGKSLYLYIKDSEDRIIKKTLYDSCSSADTFNDNTTKYEPENESNVINSAVCQGICTLEHSQKNNIFKPYNVTQKFTDLMGKKCETFTEGKAVGCDYYTCLGDATNEVNDNVIGTVRVESILPYQEINKKTNKNVTCNGYYTRYKAIINDDKQYATLYRLENDAYKICDSLIDEYGYNTDSYNSNPYYGPFLKVDDKEMFDPSIYDCETKNGVYTCKKNQKDNQEEQSNG